MLMCARASLAYFVKEHASVPMHAMVRAVKNLNLFHHRPDPVLVNRPHPSKQSKAPAMATGLVRISRAKLANAPALGNLHVIKAQETLEKEAAPNLLRATTQLAMYQTMSVVIIASVLMKVFVIPLHAHTTTMKLMRYVCVIRPDNRHFRRAKRFKLRQDRLKGAKRETHSAFPKTFIKLLILYY
mmetsp:Transcript_40660/g.75326  ORF Transcript_40660/g.75326 Transcript_40660/m.75326 type:complete len:185 (+) Transcript_40660:1041-1595(+)